MRTHSPARGVTLVELLVVMVVTLVIIAGVTVVVNTQQRAYLEGQRLRGAQGAARRALLAFERALPSAGFGMDAPLALDLAGWYAGPCPTTMGSCPRDSTGNADELVFYGRNPRYYVPDNPASDPVGNAWRIKAVTTSSVTLYGRAGDVFRNGQIFLAVCSGAASYAYFTSAQTISPPLASDQEVTVNLQPVVTANPFRRQDVAAALSCFNPNPAPGLTPARLFLVDRYRFHVRPVALGTTGGVTQYDPLLVLDRGVDRDLDGDVDADDEELIAEGIESMQVSYNFLSSALAPVATTPGTGLVTAAATPATAGTAANTVSTTSFPGGTPASGQTAYAPSSFYPYTYGPPPDPTRDTNHQANVQSVRVVLLARSLETETQGSMTANRFLPVLNQNALPSWITAYATALGGHDGYQRVVLETTVGLPNMSTRAMTYF